MDKQLISYLSTFMTDRRYELFQKVLDNRTNYITLAIEDIYQPHNASAVLRTCDCFGIQDVYVIENQNEYKINPGVELGSSQWLNLHRFNQKKSNTLDTINHLKSNGYRIVATTPHENDVNLEDFDLHKGKIGLFFGTEHTGLSEVVLTNADEFMKIPMYGFTESFNISVSAAIILHHLILRLRNSNIDWHLSDDEKTVIMKKWLLSSIKRSDLIEKEFISKFQKQ